MSTRRRLLTISLVTAAVVLVSCSDDEPTFAPTTVPSTTIAPATTEAPVTTAAPTTEAPTTTISLEQIAATYAEPGPHPVGVTTYTLAKGPKVEVWYPAVAGTTGEVSYDVRDFTPEGIRAILTADVPATFSFAGARDADADAAAGPFPVVLFSHGFTGIRLQSSFLTSHLASWGFVVVAPDHPSRDLPNVLSATASGDRADSVDDLLQSLGLVAVENTTAGSILEGIVDTDQVVAIGHSAGGGTVVGAALDERVDGYVSMASGVLIGDPTAVTTTAPDGSLPDKPSFFMAGSIDAVVPADERTVPSFEAVPTPSLLWVIDGVGHNGFDDFCTFGNGTGIIGVAEASGLGGLLDAQPQLRTLGEDGCIPPAVPVADTFPMIRHGVTAWIRHLFGIDAEPVGIGPDYAEAFAQPVRIDERP